MQGCLFTSRMHIIIQVSKASQGPRGCYGACKPLVYKVILNCGYLWPHQGWQGIFVSLDLQQIFLGMDKFIKNYVRSLKLMREIVFVCDAALETAPRHGKLFSNATKQHIVGRGKMRNVENLPRVFCRMVMRNTKLNRQMALSLILTLKLTLLSCFKLFLASPFRKISVADFPYSAFYNRTYIVDYAYAGVTGSYYRGAEFKIIQYFV